MANVVNTALNNTGQVGDGLIIDVYDKALNWELTDMPVYRQSAWIKRVPVSPTHRGYVVQVPVFDYLTPGAREIDEVVSPDSVAAPSPRFVEVTMAERGLGVARSYMLGEVEYTGQVDPAIARMLAKDAADTHDFLVRDELLTTTQRISSDGGAVSTQAAGALDAGDNLSADMARYAVTELRAGNVEPTVNELYTALIHPYVAADLRGATGASDWSPTWSAVANHSAPERIWNGYVGTYEGAVYLETNRAPHDFTGAAVSTDNHEVFTTLYLGREALVEAVIKDIGTGISPVLDKFNRHREIYWHSFLGFELFRPEAVLKVDSVSKRGRVG